MQLCKAPVSAAAQASPSPRALAISSSTSSSRPAVACATAAAAAVPTARQGGSSTRQAAPVLSVTGGSCARMGHHQQQRQQRHAATTTVLVRALKDEQAKIDRIARQADQGDVWGNEVVGGAVKVGTVAGVVAVVVLIASLAKPMYDNTIASFPTPAEYEQYDQRVREADEGF